MKGYVNFVRIDTENKNEKQVQTEVSLQIRNFLDI